MQTALALVKFNKVIFCVTQREAPTLNIDKSRVRVERARVELSWALDGASFSIGKLEVVRLSNFRTMYRVAITQLTELFAELMFDSDPMVDL